jgi:hypothetical protein
MDRGSEGRNVTVIHYKDEVMEEETAEIKREKSPSLLVKGVAILGTCALAFFTFKLLFHGKILATLVGVALLFGFYRLTPLAWGLGDLFRRFVKPDFVFASGAGDLFYKRVFWLVGPQLATVGILLFLCIMLLDVISGKALTGKTYMEEYEQQSAEATQAYNNERFDLMADPEDYPEWTAKQEDALAAFNEEYKKIVFGQAGELEAPSEFQKRKEKEQAKLVAKYDKTLRFNKCYLLKNITLPRYIKYDDGNKQDNKIDFQVYNSHFDSGCYINLFGTRYPYKDGEISKFSLDDAKKLHKLLGGVLTDVDAVAKNARIDQVVRVEENCLKGIGLYVTKRGDEPVPQPPQKH